MTAKFIKIFVVYLICSIGLISAVQAQTLIMNEVSNGPAGNQEYVEFVVYDTNVVYGCTNPSPPCIDIRGWIFDDNSGYHGASGIAAGCVRFSFDPLWSCVPVGTIITIYNSADPNTSMPAADLSLADGNCRITAPISNVSLFESNATTPGAVACSYPAVGWVPGGNWNFTLLANAGDCARIVDLGGCEVFSVCWGSANLNTLIYFAGAGTDNVWSLTNTLNNNPSNQANWTEGCTDPVACGSNVQTPGLPNNAANAAWIGTMNNNCLPITPLVVDSSLTSSDCSCNGTATANASGSIPGYTYTWSPAPGGGQGTANATGLCPGNYTCVVTSLINCSDSFVVNIPSTVVLPVITITNTTPSICIGDNATLTGNGGVSYVWSTGANTPSINVNPLTTTTYTVTGTNAAGCTNTATTTINVNPSPVPTASNSGPYCAGQNIILNALNGFANYNWAGPNLYAANNIQSPAIGSSTPIMSGIYTVTVTDANGCTGTATTNVTVNGLPIPIATNTGPYCAGTTIQLNSPTGSATDDWLGPNAFNAVDQQNPTIASSTAAMNGIYTVTVTDGNNCSATATTTVVINNLPIITANNTGPYCVGQSIQLNSPNGFATDDWTGPNLYSATNIQNPTIVSATAAMAGDYTVTVTDGNNCSSTAITTVVINSNIIFTAASNSPLCVGSQLDLTAQNIAGASYDWIGPNGFNVINQQNPSIPGITIPASGTYTVTVTNASGCTGTATTSVIVNSLPVAVANNNGPLCEGNQLNLTSNGGIDFDWIGPSGYDQPNTQNTSIVITNASNAGTYTVTVTDGNGCSSTSITDVTINTIPVASAGNNGPICEGANLDLTSSGGNTYSWIGPAGFNDPVNQNPVLVNASSGQSGTYTVTVTDLNNCTATATTIVLIQPNPLVNANTNAPLCTGINVQLNASGADTYNWVGPLGFSDPSQNAILINPTPAMNGTYTVTGTNLTGCTNSNTIQVTIFPSPTASFSGNNLLGCAPVCTDFTDLSTVIGSTITNWQWTVEGQNPSSLQNPTFCFNNPGLFDASLVVTSTDGCTSTITMSDYVVVNANPVASFIYSPDVIYESEPTVYFTNTSSGANNYGWSFGDGGSSVLANPTYTYADTGIYCIQLTVSNNAGCIDTTAQCLQIIPEFTIYIPNSFSPNMDEINPIFKVYGRGIAKLEARIFDRWGEEIFSFFDINKGWDGTTTDGYNCQLGVYVYKVTATNYLNEEFNFIGHVNLLR
jgi:gliding motility-associated-like protein